MALKLSSVLAVAVLVLGVMPASSDPTGGPDRAFVVHAEWTHGLAGDLIADYEAFHTAWLGTEDAALLDEAGIRIEPLPLEFLRGSWAIDGDDSVVPLALRAGPLDPYHVVQFLGPVKAEWRAELATKAVRVYDALPHHAYLVKLPPLAAQEIAGWDHVRFVGAYHPAYKLAPELPATGRLDLAVLTYPDEPIIGVALQIALLGGEVTSMTDTFARDGILKVTIDAAKLQDVARIPAVSWIEPAYDGITLDNAFASAIVQTGTLDLYRIHEQGVDGSTQVVSVCDTGLTTDTLAPFPPELVKKARHIMFDDPDTPAVYWNLYMPPFTNAHRKIERFYGPHDSDIPLAFLVTPGNFNDLSGHGTHVAGTVAGDVAPYGERTGDDGVAYNARLAICDILDTQFYIADDYTEYWKPAYQAGARINTNSWGSPHTNTYTVKARMHDEYVWDHPDFLITRSMGNTGSFGSMRPEAVSKSAMGIGATVNGAGMEDMASFSTRGFTADGRVKPNVVAPGSCLNSANTGTNNYRCISGTSMSTPATAGAAALVRDYFEKGFYPSGAASDDDAFNPTSALVRAVLQVSGKEITGTGSGTGFPNRDQGWGRVLLDDVLHFQGDARQLWLHEDDDGLQTGENRTIDLVVPAGASLRVMVTWNDQPGVAGANPALVNDLDLIVSGPDGTYIGNAFVGSEVPPNQGSADRRNVEEAVYVNAPTAGVYTIRILGANVPDGPQPFAVVATFG